MWPRWLQHLFKETLVYFALTGQFFHIMRAHDRISEFVYRNISLFCFNKQPMQFSSFQHFVLLFFLFDVFFTSNSDTQIHVYTFFCIGVKFDFVVLPYHVTRHTVSEFLFRNISLFCFNTQPMQFSAFRVGFLLFDVFFTSNSDT